jgi:SP family general alpha glucoside:H+ symporter-like MFS transporter
MIVSLVAVAGFIFIPFFAKNLTDLEIGEILCGIPWGVFQTLTTAYASEVCPTQLRAYLTTYVNLCWVIGQLIGSGVLRSMLQRTDQWSYRIPFAIQVSPRSITSCIPESHFSPSFCPLRLAS